VRIRAEGGNLKADKARGLVSQQPHLARHRHGLAGGIRADCAGRHHLARRAPTIDYETANGTVSFHDDAWLSDGCNEITGSQLVYNIKAQSVQGRSDGHGGARAEWPRAHRDPAAVATGKPCNAQGSKP
jgi:lipopolysaccharide export system protein LptA